ncbi:DegT/DnrJ/EryC1/StrS family aminotransferase [Brassicibacter mesophilus]|uniref:DegT/DnrJ/EryC1/StrS family aminotransferase n=1 Tax=Brassicibacter mesophilus TaxID=745119 RepID=UPI003D23E563
MINVTKTYLPNLDKYKEYVESIFQSGQITNNSQFVQELEKRLRTYLGVKNIVLVSNGTLALHLAYKLLNLKGEVITTPFSFVATASSIVWEGLQPVFSDINSKTFNIDCNKIMERINKKTSSIVPVHVFGNGCDVEEISRISNEYNLKVIYDASHAFGVKYNGKSILNYGDISTLSFHATKIFHTIEGGALIINDDKLYEKAKAMINFGIDETKEIKYLGTNGKMNEFQAAMGLCVLDDINIILSKRKKVYDNYYNILSNNNKIILQSYNDNCSHNYSYFPVVFEDEENLCNCLKDLNNNDIYPRRYFYPSLDNLGYVNSEKMHVSNEVAKKILCLPLSDSLKYNEQLQIIEIVNNNV